MRRYIKHVEYDNLDDAISDYCEDHYCQECEIEQLGLGPCDSKELLEKHHDKLVALLGLEVKDI